MSKPKDMGVVETLAGGFNVVAFAQTSTSSLLACVFFGESDNGTCISAVSSFLRDFHRPASRLL